MSDIETAIREIEKTVEEYEKGSGVEDPLEEVNRLIDEVSQSAPKTTQVVAMLSQIKHLAPAVFKLRAEQRYSEIGMGTRRLLEDTRRLKSVLLPDD